MIKAFVYLEKMRYIWRKNKRLIQSLAVSTWLHVLYEIDSIIIIRPLFICNHEVSKATYWHFPSALQITKR